MIDPISLPPQYLGSREDVRVSIQLASNSSYSLPYRQQQAAVVQFHTPAVAGKQSIVAACAVGRWRRWGGGSLMRDTLCPE